jgi:hypothetical protein
MFSLDMVGMVQAHKGLNMKGVKLLDDADYLVGELARKYDLKITLANKAIEQRTDTAPFGKYGIPAIAPNTGTESPYHKPEDTPEKLDFEGMAKVANYMSEVTGYLSRQPTLSDMTGLAEGEVPGSGVGTFRAGLLLNSGSGLHNYVDQYYKGKQIFSSAAGLMASIRLSKNLKLQPELLYETTGSKHQDGVFRTHALTAPLNVLIMTPEEEYVRGFIQLGAYYSYRFSGKIEGVPIDFDNSYQQQEFGLCYGVGLELMEIIQIGIYYQKGLSDLNRLPDNRIRQENVYFQVGFLF